MRVTGTPLRTKVIIGTLLLSIVMLAVGFSLGWWAARASFSSVGEFGAISEAALFSRVAMTHYNNADAESARNVLDAYLAYLEQRPATLADSSSPMIQTFLREPRGLATDKALVLARLALIEERAQRPTAAEPLWLRAEHEAKAAGWTDPSRELIRKVVETMDRPFTSGDAGRGSGPER